MRACKNKELHFLGKGKVFFFPFQKCMYKEKVKHFSLDENACDMEKESFFLVENACIKEKQKLKA